MIEFVFPTAAAIALYFVAVPLLTLLVLPILRAIRRRVQHGHEMGTSTVWLLLIAPVIVPSIWFITAVVHQLDGHHEVFACLVEHSVGLVCLDLLLVVVFVIAPLTFRAARQPRSRASANELRRHSFAGVTHFRGENVRGLVCTRGLLRPRIIIDDSIAAQLDDAQLRSVLLHERAHVAGYDPLRKWIARLCFSVNPLARLLRADLARWELGLEVRRDIEAVQMGADRFHLAAALVRVARHNPVTAPHCCGLVELDALELRVRILCDTELPTLTREYAIVVAGALTLLVSAPHHHSAAPLDWLHRAAESGWLVLAGG